VDTTPIRIPKDMGIIWETYRKRVPLLGVPGITLDKTAISKSPPNHPTSQRAPQAKGAPGAKGDVVMDHNMTRV